MGGRLEGGDTQDRGGSQESGGSLHKKLMSLTRQVWCVLRVLRIF